MLEEGRHQCNWSKFPTLTILPSYPQSLSDDQHEPLFCHRQFVIVIDTPEYSYEYRTSARAQCPLKALGPGSMSHRFAIEDPVPHFNLWQICSRIRSLWRLRIFQILTPLCQQYLRQPIFCWSPHQIFGSRRYSWQRRMSTACHPQERLEDVGLK